MSGRRLAAGAGRRGLPRGLGGQHHVALQAQLLQLARAAAAAPARRWRARSRRRSPPRSRWTSPAPPAAPARRAARCASAAPVASACFWADSARWRAAACSSAIFWLASFSAFCASRIMSAMRARPRFCRYCCSSDTCWTFSTSSSRPSLSKSSCAFCLQGLRELQPVLVHLLGGELGQHLAQHALQGLPGHHRDLLRGSCPGSAPRRCARGRGRWRSSRWRWPARRGGCRRSSRRWSTATSTMNRRMSMREHRLQQRGAHAPSRGAPPCSPPRCRRAGVCLRPGEDQDLVRPADVEEAADDRR